MENINIPNRKKLYIYNQMTSRKTTWHVNFKNNKRYIFTLKYS